MFISEQYKGDYSNEFSASLIDTVVENNASIWSTDYFYDFCAAYCAI